MTSSSIGLLLFLYYCFISNHVQVTMSECEGSSKPNKAMEIKFFRYTKPQNDARPRVTLVAMFPIHRADCQTLVEVKNYNGFQRMEAFSWALQEINNKRKPNTVFIEAMLYDSCSDKQHAISNVFHAKRILDLEPDNLLVGVIGASYSSVTKPLSMVTAALNLPLVSYAATNNDLSAHPLFARTVWSDDIQAEAIEDILQHFKLKSIKTIGTQGDANSDGLKKKLTDSMGEGVNMCDTIKFPLDQDNKLKESTSCEDDKDSDDWKDFREKAIHILQSKMDAFVVAIKADTKKLFLKAIRCTQNYARYDGTKKGLQLIATDTWDISDNLQDIQISEISQLLKGSMTIVPDYDDKIEQKMKKHIASVTTRKNIEDNKKLSDPQKNPWLDKIWRSVSGCDSNIDQHCDYKVVDNEFSLDTKLESVINTAALYNLAINEYINNCRHSIANCFTAKKWINGTTFFNQFILKANGEGLVGDSKIALDCDGNSLPKYGIWQWKDNKFVKSGSWKGADVLSKERGTLVKELKWNNTAKVDLFPNYPNVKDALQKKGTSCQPKCNVGEKKILLQSQDELNDECCHDCKKLDDHEIFKDGKNEPCDPGTWPNKKQDKCIPVPIETKYQGSSAPALGSILMSFVFLIVTIFYGVILRWKRSHPAVAKSGVHFLPFIFAGACLCHLFNIIIFTINLGGFSCLLIKFLSGVSPTFIFAALLIKTRKIYDIFIMTFQKEARHKNSNFIMTKFQLVCPGLSDFIRSVWEKLTPKKGITKQIVRVWFLIMIEFMIIICWSIDHAVNDVSGITAIYPYNRNIHVCSTPAIEYFYIQVFNILLFVLCTAYGYLGRNVPDDYNETRFISFSMFTVCMIWACGFFLIGMLRSETFDHRNKAHDPEILVAIFSVVMSFSAMAVVGIMLTNKVYIILKKHISPEDPDNTQDSKVVYIRPSQKTKVTIETKGGEASITDTTNIDIETTEASTTKTETAIDKLEANNKEQKNTDEKTNRPKPGLMRELTLTLDKKQKIDTTTVIDIETKEASSTTDTKTETAVDKLEANNKEQKTKDEKTNRPKPGLMRELTLTLDKKQKRKISKDEGTKEETNKQENSEAGDSQTTHEETI